MLGLSELQNEYELHIMFLLVNRITDPTNYSINMTLLKLQIGQVVC